MNPAVFVSVLASVIVSFAGAAVSPSASDVSTYEEIVNSCKKSVISAQNGACTAEIVLGSGAKRCANGAYCMGSRQCGKFDVAPGPDCPGFYSLRYIKCGRFRLTLVSRLEDETGWVLMKFSKDNDITKSGNPFVACSSEPKVRTRTNANNTNVEGEGDTVKLKYAVEGVDIDVATGKSRLVFDPPWLTCTFEFRPSPEFAYNKVNFTTYVLAGSSNSSRISKETVSWAAGTGPDGDKILRLMIDANGGSRTAAALVSWTFVAAVFKYTFA